MRIDTDNFTNIVIPIHASSYLRLISAIIRNNTLFEGKLNTVLCI